MIINEKSASSPSSSNLDSEDLPPAYNDLIHPRDALVDPPSLKPPFSHLPLHSPSTSEPAATVETPSRPAPLSPSYTGFWGWWYASQLNAEQLHIQQTIRSLLMSLITSGRTSSSNRATLGILESCRKACERYSVPFSTALQDRFIEGHSVIYWTIVKRPSTEAEEEEDPPLKTMISYAQPLTSASSAEFRAACLVSSDHRIFRRHLYPLTIPDADRLLLDLQRDSPPPDEVNVEELPGNEDEFIVKMILDEFRRRMGVRGELAVEFIAKGRLFRLSFSSSPVPSLKGKQNENAWSISLSIHEGSASTWIDSRLVIPDAAFASRISQSTLDAAEKLREKPAISVRLKTSNEPLRSTPLHLDDLSKLSRREARRIQRIREQEAEMENKIVVGLGNSSVGAGLMFPGSSYIAADGKLRATLEARLRKPETECIIC